MPQIVMDLNGEACISYEFDSLKAECFEIKQICDKYGYGNVMEWASALWRHKVIKDGRGRGVAEIGCFVPTCPSFIKEEFRHPESHAQYDNLVQAVLGNPEKEESADAKEHGRNHMNGLCAICGKPVELFGSWFCNEHIAKYSENAKKRRRRKQNGENN